LDLVVVKCPNCFAPIEVSKKYKSAECPYCKSNVSCKSVLENPVEQIGTLRFDRTECKETINTMSVKSNNIELVRIKAGQIKDIPVYYGQYNLIIETLGLFGKPASQYGITTVTVNVEEYNSNICVKMKIITPRGYFKDWDIETQISTF